MQAAGYSASVQHSVLIVPKRSVHGGQSLGPNPTTFSGFVDTQFNRQMKTKFLDFVSGGEGMLLIVIVEAKLCVV